MKKLSLKLRFTFRSSSLPASNSLLLAEEEAALGVGERCKVTRAMAAARRDGAVEASG